PPRRLTLFPYTTLFRSRPRRFRYLRRLQHLGARCAFRIFQLAVARDDQRAAQRDDHRDAEQRAEHGHQRDASDLEVEPENEDRELGRTPVTTTAPIPSP